MFRATPAEVCAVLALKEGREFEPVAMRVGNVVALVEGTPFGVGSLEFDVLHTPGHSPGGVTLKIDGCLFTGDALFAGRAAGLVGDYDVMADIDQLARDFRASLLELAEAAGVELTVSEEVRAGSRNGHRPQGKVGAVAD